MNFRPLLFTLTASTCLGEVLTLTTGERFEGDLLSISAEKGVLIASSRTPQPLALKPNSFSLLEMEGPIESDVSQTERLVLANGDILPGNLRSLDDNEIVYDGLAGDRLVLNRDKVTTLRFGIKPQNLLYEGPTPLSDWSGDGAEKWIASQDPADGLLMLEPGSMEKDVNLGAQFILKFDIKWQERPALRIYFGSEASTVFRQDRYYFDLNGGVVTIKRERSVEPRYQGLASLNQLEAFDDKNVSVELRVNRLIGTIDLYLDGALTEQMIDSAPPTKGNFIVVERGRSDNSASYLSNLQVFSWDAVSQIELMEEPGEGEIDSLVDAEGRRFSGQLMGLFSPESEDAPENEEAPEAEKPPVDEVIPEEEDSPIDEDPASEEDPSENNEELLEVSPLPSHFLLQIPFADEPLEIPTAKTRIIYFKNTLKNAPPSVFPKYELDLANNGLISATSLAITEEQITLEHPLLGKMTIPRSSVKQIRYLKELTDED